MTPGWRILAALLLLTLPCPSGAAGERTVVVLVFDGVAPSLLERHPAPTFERIRREGAFSHGLEPAFPSISLINGFTLSTGCWPARHGIVTNKFRDPERGLYDHERDADWLLDCEGLHEVAERQGVRSAALGWYGRHSESRGALASTVSEERSFDEYPDDLGRAEQVATQLARPAGEGPRLIAAYFRGPDWAAHLHGLDAEETRAAVVAMDAAVARVIRAIEALDRPTALLIATDHGMAPVTHLVNVQRLLHWHDIDAEAISTGTTSFLYFDEPSAVEPARRALAGYEQLEVLRGDALPDYARLGRSPRVPELILSARPPYFIEDPDLWPRALRWLGRWGPRFVPARLFLKASHGYPPHLPGMHGVLYAWGDGIARGREVETLRAVDLHPTAARLLGIQPGRPVDGQVARALLR